MKHKHAELIKAWADGAEIEWKTLSGEWRIASHPEWNLNTCYRIKPPELPQWRKNMAQALRDGKVVEALWSRGWDKVVITQERLLNPEVNLYEGHFRIKPEPKPDVFCIEHFYLNGEGDWSCTNAVEGNLKLIFDGETGALKDAEVLK